MVITAIPNLWLLLSPVIGYHHPIMSITVIPYPSYYYPLSCVTTIPALLCLYMINTHLHTRLPPYFVDKLALEALKIGILGINYHHPQKRLLFC